MAEGEKHMALVGLVRQYPFIITEILHQLGDSVAEAATRSGVRLRDRSENLSILKATKLSADNVFVFEGKDKRATLGIIFEVQQKPEKEKPLTWPIYYFQMRYRLNSELPKDAPHHPVRLIVFATDEKTATWARQPFREDSGLVMFQPHVIGPKELPVITDPDVARMHPVLAALTLAAHPASEPALQMATLAADAQDEHTRNILYQLFGICASTTIERLRQMSTSFDKFAGEYWQQAVALGEERGEARGEEKGIAKAFAAVVLEQMQTRFGEPSEDEVKAVRNLPVDELEKAAKSAVVLLAPDKDAVLAWLHSASEHGRKKENGSTNGSGQVPEASPEDPDHPKE